MSYEVESHKMEKVAKRRKAMERIKTLPQDPYGDDNSGYFQQEIKAVIDLFSLKNLYYTEPWVYIVVNTVARKISKQFMTIMRERLVNGTLVNRPYEGHSLINIIKKPNPFEPYSSFIYKLGAELVLMGNAIVWKLRFHKQLIILPTELVMIQYDGGKISHYLVNGALSEEYNGVFKGVIKIFPEDIIHIRLPNLNSMIWGLSPFVPGRKPVLFDSYTADYLINFYLKQSNPGVIFEMAEAANEKQAMRFLKSMELRHTGRSNQRRTMILPKGVAAKNISQTLAEQELKDHVLLKRDEIRALLNIPPHELGLQTSGSLGSDETNLQLKNFWESTIIPFQDLIADSFTSAYSTLLGEKAFFQFDNSNVKVLQEDENKKADLAIKLLQIKTINEIRAELYDASPVDGGDTIVSLKPPQFGGGFGGGQFALQSTPLQLPAPKQQTTGSQEFLEKNKDWWGTRSKAETEHVDHGERELLTVILDIFSDQAPVAMQEVQKFLKSRVKADEAPETAILRAALDTAFSKFEEVYTQRGVPTMQAMGEVGYDLQLNVPFNLPSESEIQAIRARNEQGRRASLGARALDRFQGFNATTTDEIVRTVERGMAESNSLQDIAENIRRYFGEYAPNRAFTIARTEALTAVSLGQDAAFQDAKTVIPGLKKKWITAGDGRVRDSHKDLDGKEVEADEDFSYNLAYPRDTRGSAADVINCRCTWLMLVPGDEVN